MQGGLSRSDKKLMWGALGLAVLFGIVATLLARSSARTQSPVPSSYSADSRGALAAYLLLADQHFPLQRWSDSPAELPVAAAGTVLILAEPSEPPAEVERKALAAYLENGGRVLFCGANVSAYLKAPTPRSAVGEWSQYTAVVPSPFTRGAEKITMEGSAFWPRGGVSQVRLYEKGEDAPVVTWKSGQGEVLWWSAATPLTNAGIPDTQNLQLFLNAVRTPDGRPLNVYWDEYFHGQHGGLWGYIASTPLPWGMAQLGLLALAIVFTFSRRSGPVVTPPAVSRLSPLEFVETMGALYQNSGGARIAVEASHKRLRLELAKRLHLSPTAPSVELAKAGAMRLRESESELLDAFRVGEQVLQAPKPAAKAALDSVQRMERITIRLKNPRASQSVSASQDPPRQVTEQETKA